MNHGDPPAIGFIVPCYNEQAGLPYLLTQLSSELDRLIAAKGISSKSYILIVDDGSPEREFGGHDAGEKDGQGQTEQHGAFRQCARWYHSVSLLFCARLLPVSCGAPL
jgi:hypothetical protein